MQQIEWLLQQIPSDKRKDALIKIEQIKQSVRDEETLKLFDLLENREKEECLRVLQCLLQHKRLNRAAIQKHTGLSYQICGARIDALEAKGFITYEVSGRGQAKVYGFTNQGVSFIKLYGGGK